VNRRRTLLPITIAFGLACVLVILVAAYLTVKMRHAASGLGEAEKGKTATAAPRDAAAARRAAGREAESDKPFERTATDSVGGSGGRGAAAPDEQEAIFEDTGYSITGQVVDEQDAPVASAEVLICLDFSAELGRCPVVRRLTADEVGQFRADQLPTKDLYLAAKKDNLCSYLPGLRRYWWLAKFCPVPYVEERTAAPYVELVLRPGGTIAGTVLDTDGHPVAAATVTIHNVLESQLEVRTDAAGRFRAAGLVPAGYRVSARANGFVEICTTEAVETDCEDLLIHLPRGRPIEGVVVRADTLEPAPGATVSVRPDAIRRNVAGTDVLVYSNRIETDEHGAFEVFVFPGIEMHLAAACGDYTSTEEQTAVAEPDGPVPSVTLKLVHGAAVSGTVLEQATQAPVSNVRVGVAQAFGKHPWTFSDAQGGFRLSGLVPRQNRLWISSPEYEIANVPPDTPYVEVEVTGGEELSGVSILVRRKETLSGRIENEEGQPVFGALVLVKEEERDPANASAWLGETCVSDPAGRFATHRRGRNASITAIFVCHPEYAQKLVEFGPDAWANSSDKEIVVVLQKGGGCVGGTVRDDAATPIAHAVVRLHDTDKFGPSVSRQGVCLTSADTDDQGRYAFAGVGPGTYEVEAQVGTRTMRSGPVVVAQDARITDVDLVIPSPGHIEGRVVEADGPPLAGVTVSCVRVRDWNWLPRTTTDEEGRYRFDGLVKGDEYQIEVRPGPGAAYSSAGMRSVICSADGVDVVLKRLATGTVKGFVYRESDRSPVKEYNLTLTSVRERFWVSQDVVSEDGAFVCENVPAGQAMIYVRVPGLPRVEGKPFDVVAGEETTHIVYVSEPGTIRGTVYRASDSSPVTSFHLSLMPIDEAGRFSEYPPGEFRVRLYESEDGSFVCEGVKPGRYVLGILAEGLRDFQSEPFEVVASQETTQDLVLDEGASIQGRVIDESGRPVADAVVEESDSLNARRGRMGVWGERSRLECPRGTTDSSGEFTLHNLTPGQVTLKATHPDYAAKEVRTEIPPEGQTAEKLTIQLERGTLLHGWVRGLDGEPLSGISLNLRGGGNPRTTTDHRGEYRFEHLPGGTYRIGLNYLSVSLPQFKLDGEEEKEVNIDLSQAGSVSGTLVVPNDVDDVWFRVDFHGLDDLEGCSRYVRLTEDLSFELRGLLPGKYRVSVSGYRRDGGRAPLEVTTNSGNVTIDVDPKEQVKTTIEVSSVTERIPSRR
jgi:protocatechuate 3,4-dioxygenase beta subunit